MKKKTEMRGILYRDLKADPMTAEEQDRFYFSAFPDDAYKELVMLRGNFSKAVELAKAYEHLILSLMETLTEKAADRAKVEPLVRHARKLQASLDTKAGMLENTRRAGKTKKAIADHVMRRVGQNPAITPKELTVEVMKWAKKNKKGEPYKFEYLLPKVSKLVTEAKKAFRRGKL